MAVKGSFKDISFTEILQMVHLSKKTGRLEITIDKKWAMVVFREGVVWHVEPRGFQGATPDEVIYQLISAAEGSFTFQRVQVLPTLERSVNQNIESLIMEGTKRIDDQSAVASEMGGEQQMAQVLRLKPGAEAKVRYVPQAVKKVLQVIDGTKSLADVLKGSGLESNQAAQIVKDLINHGILESVDASKKEEQQEPAQE